MFTGYDVSNNKVTLTKNLISDQTESNLTVALGTPAFNVTHGYGASTNASVIVAIHAGGFNDQRITATMKWVPPTASPNEEFGVVARFQSAETTPTQTYYYARCDGGTAKLTKVVGGTFTNLSTGAFALSQNANVTISLTCVGNAISASFNAGGSPATVNLSATDSSITTGGLMGFRTLSTSGYCANFVAEQV